MANSTPLRSPVRFSNSRWPGSRASGTTTRGLLSSTSLQAVHRRDHGSVPLCRYETGFKPVDDGCYLHPVLGLARLDQLTQSVRLPGEQRLGTGAGVADKRVMDHVVVGQSRVFCEVLQGRPWVR